MINVADRERIIIVKIKFSIQCSMSTKNDRLRWIDGW